MDAHSEGKKRYGELRFLGKALLFCIPIAVVLGIPVVLLYRAGELLPDDVMAARQAAVPGTVVGLAFSNPLNYLNLHAALLEQPQILVMGSSRVGELRESFFKSGTKIYIASGLQKIGHFLPFLSRIPAGKNPKVIIMGLDEKFFDPNYDSLAPDNIEDLLSNPISPLDIFATWPLVYSDYFQGKYSLAGLWSAPSSSIGFAAIARNAGFRSDGSHQMGSGIYVPPAGDPTFSQIAQGIQGFEYSDAVSQGALRKLDAFLAECKARGIYVIGFVPPFRQDVYQTLLTMGDQYGYLKGLSPDIAPIFGKYGFGFYNFTDPAPLGIGLAEMEDGIHTTERGSLIMFIKMLQTDSALARYADPARLKAALNATTVQADILP